MHSYIRLGRKGKMYSLSADSNLKTEPKLKSFNIVPTYKQAHVLAAENVTCFLSHDFLMSSPCFFGKC
jgi:hypothetical protein